MNSFNDTFRDRTKKFAVEIIKFFKKLKYSDEGKIIGKQILRSGTSLAANFRAACRARSDAEYFAKICIVVEEADETLFWFELLVESDLFRKSDIDDLIKECTELLSVMAVTKKNLKSKIKRK
jgi:four helix bundle protein